MGPVVVTLSIALVYATIGVIFPNVIIVAIVLTAFHLALGVFFIILQALCRWEKSDA